MLSLHQHLNVTSLSELQNQEALTRSLSCRVFIRPTNNSAHHLISLNLDMDRITMETVTEERQCQTLKCGPIPIVMAALSNLKHVLHA